MSTRATFSFLLAAAAAGIIWVWLQHDPTTHEQSGVVGPDGLVTPAPTEKTEQRDSFIEGERVELLVPDKVSQGTAGDGMLEPFAPPPPGVLSIMGLVQSDEELPVVGARLNVSRDLDYPPWREPIGSTRTRADGSYVFPLRALESLPRVLRDDSYLHVDVIAPGFGHAEESVATIQREGDVVRCDFVLDSAALMFVGTVLSETGEAIPEAYIKAVAWGQAGQDIEVQDAQSSALGQFVVEVSKPGRVDLRIGHPSHGTAHVDARASVRNPFVDLGMIVLVPEIGLTGTVVSAGGTPIPGLGVDVWPASDDVNYDSFEVRTDARGRFRFATLSDCDYVLSTGYEAEERVVQPSRNDIRIRIPMASIRVSVRGAAGNVFPGVNVDVTGLTRTDDGDWIPNGASVDDSTVGEGKLQFLVQGEGTYGVYARASTEGGRWSASERITLRPGKDAEVELILQREDYPPTTITVLDPDGNSMDGWTTSARSLTTGASYGSAKSGRPVIECPPDRYVFGTRTESESLVRGFTQYAEITAETRSLELRATEWLAALDLSVRTDVAMLNKKQRATVELRALDSSDGVTTVTASVAIDGKSSLLVRRPGRYQLQVRSKGFEKLTREVEIHEKETRPLSVTLLPAVD